MKALFRWLEPKLKTVPEMYEYVVVIQRKGEDYPAYTLYSTAESEAAAKEDAIMFLVQNGWWPFSATEEWIRSQLMIVDISLRAQ